MNSTSQKYLISAIVENTSGLLAKFADLFGQKSYNIDALTVAPTRHDIYSRLTVVTYADSSCLEKILEDLQSLEGVVKVQHLSQDDYVSRELLLVKVQAHGEDHFEVMKIIRQVRGELLDEESGALIFAMTQSPADNLNTLEALEPYGIVEIVRSGQVAIGKGEQALKNS